MAAESSWQRRQKMNGRGTWRSSSTAQLAESVSASDHPHYAWCSCDPAALGGFHTLSQGRIMVTKSKHNRGQFKEIVAEISKQKKRGTKNEKQKWVVQGLIPCETSALCGSYPALSAANPHEKNEKQTEGRAAA